MIELIEAYMFQERVIDAEEPVLVTFRSEWSGSCHIVNSSLTELSDEFDGKMLFYALDVDACKKLTNEYRIHKLPTILFFNNGELIDKLMGPNSKSVVREHIIEVILKGK